MLRAGDRLGESTDAARRGKALTEDLALRLARTMVPMRSRPNVSDTWRCTASVPDGGCPR